MIKQALMTTAYTRDRDGKALLDETHSTVATVWDMGAGHVDPEKAVDPGLVYDRRRMLYWFPLRHELQE